MRRQPRRPCGSKRAKKLGPWEMWAAVHENNLVDYVGAQPLNTPKRNREAFVEDILGDEWKLVRVKVSIVRSKSKRRKKP